MVVQKYRHLVTRYFAGPIEFCKKHHITPNMISVFAFIVSILAAICYAFPAYFLYWYFFQWVPPALFFFSGYLDALDGAVARATNQSSKFGAFLDSTLDRISDAVIIIGLMYSGILWPNQLLNNLIGFIALTSILLISYTRSRAELEGVVMKGIGFMERAERVFILLGGYIIEACIFFWGKVIQIYYPEFPIFRWFYPIFFLVFTICCVQTLFARVIWVYKWLNNKMPEKVTEILNAQKAVSNPAPSAETQQK
jgi:archaetidylinositol phosphate synthase